MTTSKEIDAENIKYKVNMDFTLGVPALAIYVICKSQNIKCSIKFASRGMPRLKLDLNWTQ